MKIRSKLISAVADFLADQYEGPISIESETGFFLASTQLNQ